MKPLNRPCRCGETEASAFGRYAYTTNQGKRLTRRDSRCKECRRAARVDRYRAHPESQRASARAWKIANAEHMRAYYSARQKTEYFRALKAKAQRARKARMRAGMPAGPEEPRILAVYQEAKDTERKLRACVSCDDDLELQVHVDHIVPLSRGGKHVFANLQILSGRENLEKGARV